MKNRLEVTKGEFGTAIEIFRVRRLANSALLAFENGFLSIEAGDRHVTIRALGEWQGRAWFSSNLLKALAAVPPAEDPVVVSYDGAKLRIGTIAVDCEWQVVSKAFIKDVTNPSLLDLLAMDRTLHRSEILRTTLGKRIESARSKLAERIEKAAKLLEEAEISKDDLWALAERGIKRRFMP